MLNNNVSKFLVKHDLHRVIPFRWKFSHHAGVNSYFECRYSGERTVKCPDVGCYSPLDQKWLFGDK